MHVLDAYAGINALMDQGETRYFGPTGDGPGFFTASGAGRRKIRSVRIGVYCGGGTSHSWLWFTDLLERAGFFDTVFLDEHDVREYGLDHLDVFCVSGGDTFGVAKALGQKGADAIRSFVLNGGLYIGACAGAYLPMNSSKPDLNLFNFAPVKIANLSKYLPENQALPAKFCTGYGCGFVFHPVREGVRLALSGRAPFFGKAEATAPMYGGPVMEIPEAGDVLATYDGFEEKTLFLVERPLAEKTLLEKAAVVRMAFGRGAFYLFGPHFEHPGFPEANRMVADAILWETAGARRTGSRPEAPGPDMLSGTALKQRVLDIKRELSNSRIVAVGLSLMPISWMIGKKSYEPEKIRVYLESLWKRIGFLSSLDKAPVTEARAQAMADAAVRTTSTLRELKQLADAGGESTACAERAMDLLHALSRMFFNLYFKARMGERRAGLSWNETRKSRSRARGRKHRQTRVQRDAGRIPAGM